MEEKQVTKSFNSRLHQLMNERGLSQQKVADYAGVTQTSVSRWLSGSIPEIENVSLLAKRAGVPLAWLAHGEGSIDPPVMTLEQYIERAASRILPRIDTVLQRLDEILEEPWLNGVDTDLMESLCIKFRERRGSLVELIRTFEQLPSDDVPLIEEKLFGKKAFPGNDPALDLRILLCHFLRIKNRNASDEEILERCKQILEGNPTRKSILADRRNRARAGRVNVNKRTLEAHKKK